MKRVSRKSLIIKPFEQKKAKQLFVKCLDFLRTAGIKQSKIFGWLDLEIFSEP